MFTVRDITVEDIEKFRELLIRLVNEKPPVALELEPLIMKGKEWIAKFPKGDMGCFIVAEGNDKFIGFCYVAVQKFYNPVAYIGIAVDKEHRRKDIGESMFYHVAEWAAARHLQYIVADVWSWNLSSIRFFKRLGFEAKSRFKEKFKGEEKEKIRLVLKL
jgi:RimJ/RimL family protein N-acetyltransferase